MTSVSVALLAQALSSRLAPRTHIPLGRLSYLPINVPAKVDMHYIFIPLLYENLTGLKDTGRDVRHFKFSPAAPAAGEADDRPPPAPGPIRVRPGSRSLPHLFLLPPTIIPDFHPRSFSLYSIPDADNPYLNLVGP